jgi:general secretion pathway protein A
MYTEYFGFQEEPFNLTPDPKFLYFSEAHKEALTRLKYGIEMRKGLVVLTGDVGSGKTTIILTFIGKRPDNLHTAVIVNPKIIGSKLLSSICREFGVDLDFKEISKSDILNILYEYVLKKSFYNKNFAVIIDDAHDLNRSQLDDILLLTKLETNTKKLVQLALVGLPEINAKLKAPEFLPLSQRVQIRYHLKSFSYSDTQNYIFQRLSKAGYGKKDIFKAEAVQRIFQISKGIPRTISVVASNALLYAYMNGLKKIDHRVVNLSTDESMQEVINTGSNTEKVPMNEGAFSSVEEKIENFKKSRKWYKWILLVFFVIVALIGLNIVAQYITQLLHIF